MQRPRIVLLGLGKRLEGLQWESDSALRIGRQDNLDIVLDDPCLHRRHAEIHRSGSRWVIRDLANNDRFPTLVNGARVHGECQLTLRDLIQVGSVCFRVAVLEVECPTPEPTQATDNGSPPGDSLKTTRGFMKIQARAQNTWDQSLQVAAAQKQRTEPGRTDLPADPQGMLTLLRTSHHLCHIANVDELLQSILADAVGALAAQRGSIILLNPLLGQLQLRASFATAGGGQACYSRTLAQRAFQNGESFLCRDIRFDSDLFLARSIQQGTMASVISALLRSPRQRLGVLQLDRGPFQEAFTESDLVLADAIAANVAVGIECAQLIEAQRDQFIETVTSLARAVEVRDQYTGDHTRRVTDYSLLLADELRLPPLEKYQIQIGTPLHDIGKIGIDDAILRKPGKLTVSEFEFMKSHTVKGAAILQSINNLSPMIPIVRHHHERWDGTGYPDRLGRDQIALTARIVAVADAFDAMTSDRPYRPALSIEHAYQELIRMTGTHFDPSCTKAFVHLRPKVEGLLKQT